MNIVDPILFQCQRQPPAAAICVPGPGIGLISYRRLAQFIHNFSRRLHAMGLPEHGIVAISIDDGILHAVAILASIRLGLIPLSLRGGDLALPFGVDAVLADASRQIPGAARSIVADLSWTQGDGRPLEAHHLPPTHDDDLCRLILTSGTSNMPKAVPLSHRLLASRIARHPSFGNRIGNCSRVYSDVPMSSSLGFQFMIATLSRGGTMFFPGPDFASTLQVVEEYGVECLVGSPGGLENLLRWLENLPSYQSNIDVVFCGGDVLSRTLSERLRARVCTHLIAAYGSTEASMCAIAHAHEIATVPRAVGFITPGVVAQIVDPSGTLLPPGQEGRVRLRSEFAVDHYLGDPEESKKTFRDGWFYPGDLGTLSAEGLLVITGREHAVLNLGGDKISPELIEQVLGRFPGVAEAAAAVVPNAYGNNEVCALVVAGSPLDENALRAFAAENMLQSFAPVRYLFVASLPHNEMGKLDRARLPELVAAAAGNPGR